MNDPSLHVRELRLWFAITVRGFVASLAGLLFLSDPSLAPEAVAGLLVAYLLLDGGLSLYAARRAARAGRSSRKLVLTAVVDVAAAAVAVAMPAVLPLRLAAGARAIAGGACEALWSYREGLNELLVMAGVAAVALGAVILGWPGPATLALPWLLGLEAMVSGALLVAGASSELRRPVAIAPA